MKKAIGKLTKSEKVSLRKGDKSVLYEKLGLIEEKDLKAYQSKFGIDKDQMKTEEDLAKNLEDKHMISEKRQKSKYHKQRELEGKTQFLSIVHQLKEQKDQMAAMDEDELQEAKAH